MHWVDYQIPLGVSEIPERRSGDLTEREVGRLGQTQEQARTL